VVRIDCYVTWEGETTRLSDKAENGEGTEKERRDFCRAFGTEKLIIYTFLSLLLIPE